MSTVTIMENFQSLKELSYTNGGNYMRKYFSFIFVVILVVSCVSVCANAQKVSTTVEYLEDGSYIVTEITTTNPNARAGISGDKRQTYYNSSSKQIFSVTVTGQFTYSYGVSVSATGGSVKVSIHDSGATFVEKYANPSGNTVYGHGSVMYLNVKRSLNPKITCDKYGNLS